MSSTHVLSVGNATVYRVFWYSTVCYLKGKRGNHCQTIVSAWVSAVDAVIGQESVADKSNEITAVPKVLEAHDLTWGGVICCIITLGTCATSRFAKIIDEKTLQ